MDLKQEIQKDFGEQIAFLKNQKMSTRLRLHHKRAGIVGSLLFLADLADKNGMMQEYKRLVDLANFTKDAMEVQFKENWVHNMMDVTKMDMAFLCDIAAGYNAARVQYDDPGITVPAKIAPATCRNKPSPAVKKAINALVKKLVAE